MSPAPTIDRAAVGLKLFHQAIRQAHLLEQAAAHYSQVSGDDGHAAMVEIVDTFIETIDDLVRQGIDAGVLEDVEHVPVPSLSTDFYHFAIALAHDGWQPPAVTEGTP